MQVIGNRIKPLLYFFTHVSNNSAACDCVSDTYFYVLHVHVPSTPVAMINKNGTEWICLRLTRGVGDARKTAVCNNLTRIHGDYGQAIISIASKIEVVGVRVIESSVIDVRGRTSNIIPANASRGS